MRIKRVDIPIYYGYLVIIISNDYRAVADKYGLKEAVENFGAFVWGNRNANGIMEFYVCIDEDCSNHLIAHEVVHLVNHIFLDKGIELDRHNDEPQAYLTGWLFSEIEKFKDKTNKNETKQSKKAV